MRKMFFIFAVFIPIVTVVCVMSFGFIHITQAKAEGSGCTPTGFFRDSINLTAALINPPGIVTGTLDASRCNIGIYYGPGSSGTVSHAEIFGANYFGVVNNGGTVSVIQSRIHDIGESPLNGDQHGIGIYFAFNTVASGKLISNRIWNYQKGGIVDNSGLSNTVTIISDNTVLGQGPVDYIAQNGIQIGYGAKAVVTGNTVTGNSYTGSNDAASGGIIVVGGPCYGGPVTTGTKISGNLVKGNDVGIWVTNLDANCGPVTTATKILVFGNTITNDAINNTTGNFPGPGGYQAGIADQGDFDSLIGNTICGLGYTSPSSPAAQIFTIDVTVTNHPIVLLNHICGHSISLGSSEDLRFPKLSLWDLDR